MGSNTLGLNTLFEAGCPATIAMMQRLLSYCTRGLTCALPSAGVVYALRDALQKFSQANVALERKL
jgi:hypothetical protein